MQIRLGDTAARCETCEGNDFVHLDPGTELNEFSELLCSCCETPASQGDLIVQIAGRALAEAGKRMRRKPRKKV
jgi:hypothetical protein